MIEFIVGIFGIILLYFLGQLLFPETNNHKPIIPEPWQRDYRRHEQNLKGAEEDE